MILALVWMMAFAGQYRKYYGALLVLFALCLVLLPEGIERVSTINNIKADLSIWNRLVLWEGVGRMALDNPIWGVGYENLGDYYRAWYQPRDRFQDYNYAVSDYFTLASGGGLGVLCAYVMLGVFPIACLFRTRSADGFFHLTGSLLYYLFFGFFTHTILLPTVSVFFIFVLILVYIRVITLFCMQENVFSFFCSAMRASAIAALFVASIVVSFGSSFDHDDNVNVTSFKIAHEAFVESLEVIKIENSTVEKEGNLLFLSSGFSEFWVGRCFARELASGNWRVFVVRDNLHSLESLKGLKSLVDRIELDYPDSSLSIVGFGEGGRAGLVEASRKRNGFITSVVSISAKLSSPFDALSAAGRLPQDNVAVMLTYCASDSGRSREEAARFFKKCREAGLQIELLNMDYAPLNCLAEGGAKLSAAVFDFLKQSNLRSALEHSAEE